MAVGAAGGRAGPAGAWRGACACHLRQGRRRPRPLHAARRRGRELLAAEPPVARPQGDDRVAGRDVWAGHAVQPAVAVAPTLCTGFDFHQATAPAAAADGGSPNLHPHVAQLLPSHRARPATPAVLPGLVASRHAPRCQAGRHPPGGIYGCSARPRRRRADRLGRRRQRRRRRWRRRRERERGGVSVFRTEHIVWHLSGHVGRRVDRQAPLRRSRSPASRAAAAGPTRREPKQRRGPRGRRRQRRAHATPSSAQRQ